VALHWPPKCYTTAEPRSNIKISCVTQGVSACPWKEPYWSKAVDAGSPTAPPCPGAATATTRPTLRATATSKSRTAFGRARSPSSTACRLSGQWSSPRVLPFSDLHLSLSSGLHLRLQSSQSHRSYRRSKPVCHVQGHTLPPSDAPGRKQVRFSPPHKLTYPSAVLWSSFHARLMLESLPSLS